MGETSLNVPKEVLEPIIQAHISAAVASALCDRTKILEIAVAKVLNEQVESDGSKVRYANCSGSLPWINWCMQECIRKAAKAALEQFFETQTDVIRQQITKELSKKNSPIVAQIIQGMMTNLVNADTLKYRLNITVQ